MRRILVLAAGLLVGMAVYVVAQSTVRRITDISNFIYGLKLNGSTTITGASGTGDAAVNLPANSVSLGSEVSGFATPVRFCGDLVNTATTFLGPALTGFNGTPTDYVITGAACSALDNTTEASARNPISTLPTKATGMKCKIDAAPGSTNSVVFTLRDNSADAVTTDGTATQITCTILGAATECRSVAGTTTNIGASDPLDVKAVSNYDASARHAGCDVLVSWP